MNSRRSTVVALAALLLMPPAGLNAAGGVWVDVPYVRQESNGCGAAVLSMIMRYWSGQAASLQVREEAADPQRIQRELYAEDAGGIFASDLIAYLERNGFATHVLQGQWEDFELHLAQGRPLIAALGQGRGRPLHYVVVAGLDWEKEIILVNDPARRKLLKLRRADFEQSWQQTENWLLLALPASD